MNGTIQFVAEEMLGLSGTDRDDNPNVGISTAIMDKEREQVIRSKMHLSICFVIVCGYARS